MAKRGRALDLPTPGVARKILGSLATRRSRFPPARRAVGEWNDSSKLGHRRRKVDLGVTRGRWRAQNESPSFALLQNLPLGIAMRGIPPGFHFIGDDDPQLHTHG